MTEEGWRSQRWPGQNDTVSFAGADIAEVASHFQEVDLQDTLIVEWTEVRRQKHDTE